MLRHLKVGDKAIEWGFGFEDEYAEVVIVRIGRKYIYAAKKELAVHEATWKKYSKFDGYSAGNSVFNYMLFPSTEELKHYIKCKKARRYLDILISWDKVNDDTVLRIMDILKEEQERKK